MIYGRIFKIQRQVTNSVMMRRTDARQAQAAILSWSPLTVAEMAWCGISGYCGPFWMFFSDKYARIKV